MVHGILLNFDKRYKDNIRVIFDHWPKLHLGLDSLSNQKITICNGFWTKLYLVLMTRYAVPDFCIGDCNKLSSQYLIGVYLPFLKLCFYCENEL